MTIDEAISHAREVAECQKMSARLIEDNAYIPESVDKEAITYGNTICANEHEQLAEWLEELKQYRAIGTVEECRAAMEKQIVEKELESHDEKYILKYCISLMQELVGKFEEWYEYVHGEDAIRELDEEERFYYRMSYFSIVQELFLFRTSHSGGTSTPPPFLKVLRILFRTSHSGGTSTRAKCKQLGVDWSDGIEFSFGGDEERTKN